MVDLGGQLRVPELVDDQVAELRLVFGEQGGEPLHHLGALLDRASRPVRLVERLARCFDGAVDVGLVARGDIADLLAGGRRNDLEALVRVRLLPAAVDVEIGIFAWQHEELSSSRLVLGGLRG